MKASMFLVVFLLVCVAGASAKPSGCDSVHIVSRLVSWGFKSVSHPRKIEAIIIHSSYNATTADSFSLKGVLQEYKDAGVSPHYIIDRAGKIYRLVPDGDIAYQAGRSRLPDGTTNVNAVSIGIEIINTTKDSPTEAQYISLAKLVRCLESEYPIKFVLGHKDIAPGRKTDPWNFNWKKFRALLDEQDRVGKQN